MLRPRKRISLSKCSTFRRMGFGVCRDAFRPMFPKAEGRGRRLTRSRPAAAETGAVRLKDHPLSHGPVARHGSDAVRVPLTRPGPISARGSPDARRAEPCRSSRKPMGLRYRPSPEEGLATGAAKFGSSGGVHIPAQTRGRGCDRRPSEVVGKSQCSRRSRHYYPAKSSVAAQERSISQG